MNTIKQRNFVLGGGDIITYANCKLFLQKILMLLQKILMFDIFKTGILKTFEPKKSHHFVDLNELILKMYTVLRFKIIFLK